MVRAHPEITGLVDWQPLARGGFSTVWRARQETLDRLVAVKIDHRPLHEDSDRRRFLREAGAAGRLSGHAGIVTVHDAGILDDGRPYLVMDLCPGGSLTKWLKPEGRQSQRRIRDIGVRIADALAAAHARGILHRDVKPGNILIDAYDHPGLADFGLASLPEPGEDLSVTLEGMTPAYAAKEVFYREPPSAAGDVYSLAATLYALLDGKPPRWPDTGTPSLPELLELQREPIERLPDVDDEFMDLLLAAMDDDPVARPTAGQFRDRLAGLSFTPTTDPGAITQSAPRGSGPAASPPVIALDDDLELSGGSGRSGGSVAATPAALRRRPLLVVVLAAVVVAALLAVGVSRWGPSGRAAVPVPSTVAASPARTSSAARTASPASPSPSTSLPAPEGFVDCSAELGPGSFCVVVTEPECWLNYFQYADVLAAADMTECDAYHEHQTFAAGTLPTVVNRQSRLERRKEVRQLCTRKTLNKVLGSGDALKAWQIRVLLPVDITSDNLFRCLVGPAQNSPHKLRIPS